MDHLHLKWGTIKSFDFSNSPHALSAYEEYVEIEQCMSAMLREDTPQQKELICKMIDSVNGDIIISWTGENCANDREKAKKYVMEYGTKDKMLSKKTKRASWSNSLDLVDTKYWPLLLFIGAVLGFILGNIVRLFHQ